MASERDYETLGINKIETGAVDKCARREPISVFIRNQVDYLRRQAEQLENLAKLMDFLPKELENALYPYIMDSIQSSPKRFY